MKGKDKFELLPAKETLAIPEVDSCSNVKTYQSIRTLAVLEVTGSTRYRIPTNPRTLGVPEVGSTTHVNTNCELRQ